jgi:hypothetical protein
MGNSEQDNKLIPIEVFTAYSHKDERLRNKLESHLSPLKRLGIVTAWHDRRIVAGKDWRKEIDEHLNSAKVILLLISADFLASDYCYGIEMTRALERHEVGTATVIPVILKDVDWGGAPFSKLQALPRDGKPVTRWPTQDAGFADVARGIRVAIENLVSVHPMETKETYLPLDRLEDTKLSPSSPSTHLGASSQKDSEIRTDSKVEPISSLQTPQHLTEIQDAVTNTPPSASTNVSTVYEPLGKYLQQQDRTQRQVELTFSEIKKLLAGKVPLSAYQHEAWWANNRDNLQAQQWLDAGWAVKRASYYDEVITFVPITTRGEAYIEFYNRLITSLRRSSSFALRDVFPDGSSWLFVTYLPVEDVFSAMLSFSFSRSNPFSIDLKLLPGNKLGAAKRTESVFISLREQKDQIERELGKRLRWLPESVVGQPTFRVELNYEGGTNDTEEQLINWAIENINDFYRVLLAHIQEIINP